MEFLPHLIGIFYTALKKMKITIIVPILNESPILGRALDELHQALEDTSHPDWEVIVADAGSHDGSREMAEARTNQWGWRLEHEALPFPSVGKTVRLGLGVATGEVAVILPSDCTLESASLGALAEAVSQGATCGGFRKHYVPSTFLLRLYAGAQNFVRSALLRHLVWTNALFFRLPRTIPTGGFLEDVMLSDELRREKGWRLIDARVLVSSRRYYPNRVIRRIGVNLVIMLCHRFRLAGPTRLKKIYLTLK